MKKTRIKSVDVRGFRAFGLSPQSLAFSSDIAVVWGPNSQGKTSLAEAFEFLFTGSIVRRDLLASAKDEFAGTLRNVHLQDEDEVFVEIELEHDGKPHTVRRTLLSDYAKKGDCETKLEVDGQSAEENAFQGIGVKLSQPPLAAPVLMQHTLPYVFSAGPKDRSAYFKALLDVEDLDRFLELVESHGVELEEPSELVLRDLRSCSAREAMCEPLAPLLREKDRSLDVEQALSAAAAGLLKEAGVELPDGAQALFSAVEKALHSRQTDTFPLADLGMRDLDSWAFNSAGLGAATDDLEEQRTKVDAEIERLIPLFEAALRVEAIGKATEPQHCPLCEDGTLSIERISAIRAKLQGTKEFQRAEASAHSALTGLSDTLKGARDGVERALPLFMRSSSMQRKERGFHVDRARRLAGVDGHESVSQWLAATRTLLRVWRALRLQVAEVTGSISELSSKLSSLDNAVYETLWEAVGRIVELRAELDEATASYRGAEDALLAVLPSAVAKESKTEGWQELIDLWAKHDDLSSALNEWEARCRVQRELERAVKALKKGMGEVLDEKISAISGDVAVVEFASPR